MMKPNLTIGICLGLAAVCAIAAIWGLANRVGNPYGDWPLIAAVVGVVLGIGALLLAAIVWYRVKIAKT